MRWNWCGIWVGLGSSWMGNPIYCPIVWAQHGMFFDLFSKHLHNLKDGWYFLKIIFLLEWQAEVIMWWGKILILPQENLLNKLTNLVFCPKLSSFHTCTSSCKIKYELLYLVGIVGRGELILYTGEIKRSFSKANSLQVIFFVWKKNFFFSP